MARKKRKEEEAGGEGWLATFSDMVSLLLCFFVILYNSNPNQDTVINAVADYFSQLSNYGYSLSIGRMQSTGNALASLPSATRGRALADALRRAISLFNPEIKSSKVKVTQDERGVVISFASDMFFAPASATLNLEAARSTLLNLVVLLTSSEVTGKKFRIEGHTDSTPVDAKGPWVSNWQLSTERALSVLYYLIEMGVPEKQMQVAGFGDTVPVSSDNTPEGRAYNRRVDIVIIDSAHL
ncbi:MAG: flagellar motor protein MotB [Treponema sp.]|nr:flagellar motor protein MotB [Treponema sp.]